ncbi:unnamed protein product [Oncorhynchus mykiss]|uniref:TSC22 domain family protein 1 n=1 Tax=Oncorhynchus mykiss TaxID=8022 RepID=A0A060WAJ5_ONCMY|nr:unnamed protein product [Oncorhynchus mykiss]
MRCKMSYSLPSTPGTSPAYSGRFVSYRARCRVAPLFLIPSVLTLFFSYLHSASGASVVAIDNKIEQAMDLVKSHLMYAVREEVEVLKEQIKELYERNSQLEQENAVLKSLANMDQLTQLSSTQISPAGSTSPSQQLPSTNNANTNTPLEGETQAFSLPQQPDVTSV